MIMSPCTCTDPDGSLMLPEYCPRAASSYAQTKNNKGRTFGRVARIARGFRSKHSAQAAYGFRFFGFIRDLKGYEALPGGGCPLLQRHQHDHRALALLHHAHGLP